jgi:hypothetical protein
MYGHPLKTEINKECSKLRLPVTIHNNEFYPTPEKNLRLNYKAIRYRSIEAKNDEGISFSFTWLA